MDSYRPHQKWMWYTDAQYHLVQRLETGEWKKFQLNNRGSHGRQGIYKYNRGSIQVNAIAHPPLKSASLQRMTECNPYYSWPWPSFTWYTTSVEPIDLAAGREVHPYYEFLYRNFTFTTEKCSKVSAALQQGTLLACCDGSYNPMELTASYGATFGTSEF